MTTGPGYVAPAFDWAELTKIAIHEASHVAAARAVGCTGLSLHVGQRRGAVIIADPPGDARALALVGVAGIVGEMLHEDPDVTAAAVVRAVESGDERMSREDRVLAPAVDLQLAEVALQVLRQAWPSIREEARAAALAAVRESQQQAPAARRPGVVYLGD